jgi:hypothetical protein
MHVCSVNSKSALIFYSVGLWIHMILWDHLLELWALPPLFDKQEVGIWQVKKTLPTIRGTYMKLVTKYQISAINSCWEKCDEKWAYMFNVYENQLSRQTGSRNLMGPKTLPTIWDTHMKLVTKYQISAINSCLIFIHIEHISTFFVTFFSATIDGRDLVFGHKLHMGIPYRGKRFWTHQIPTSCLPT